MSDFLKKTFKVVLKVLAVLAIIVLVLFLIFAIAVQFFDVNKHKQIFEKTFHQQTGQQLRLNGPIKIAFLPNPRARFEDAMMTITYKGNQMQVFAKEFAFDLGWSFLFSDKVNIKSITGQYVTIQFFGKNSQSQKFNVESFSGQIHSSCCDVNIPSFHLKIGDETINGNLNIGLMTNTPKIKGMLNATQWSLPLLTSQDAEKEKPLTSVSFPLDWINEIEGQVDFHVDKLVLNDKPVENVDINFNLKDKTLTITPKAKVEGGKVNGKVTLKRSDDASLNLDIALNVKDSNAKFFLQKFSGKKINLQKFPIHEGTLDYQYNASATGKSIEALFNNMKAKSLIDLKNIKVDYLENTFTGNLNFISTATATKVTGKLTTPQLKLPSSQDNWNFSWLKNLQGQVNLHIDNLIIDKIQAKNADILLSAKNNELTLTPQAVVAGGKLTGEFTIQPNEKTNTVRSTFNLHQATASELLKLFSPNAALQNGSVEVDFKGKGAGSNLHSIISNLSGNILINIQGLSVEQLKMDSRYVDLFAALWKAFTPSQPGTLLECAVLRFDIANGQAHANQSIGIETADLAILGGGNMDLSNQQIDFTFDMSPRSHFNVELGSFSNVVYLKGTLAQPQVSASMQGVVKEGGSLALGIVTSGVSVLVEKLAKMVTQNKSVCQQVLAGG